MSRSVLALAGCVMAAALAAAITSPTAAPTVARTSLPVAFEPAASLTPAPPGEPYRFDASASGSEDAGASPESEFRPADADRSAGASPATRAPRVPRARSGSALAPQASGSVAAFLADSLFRQLDSDGDGVLTGVEIPTAFRAAADARGTIDAQTFTPLFQAAVQKLSAAQTAPPGVAVAPPNGLPKWFTTLDPAGTGQVTLHAWRTAGGTLTAFQRMDANGDGLLTQREVLAVNSQPGAVGAAVGGSLKGAGAASGPAGATSAGSESTAGGGTKPASRADALLAHYGAIVARASKARAGAKTPAGDAPAVSVAGGAGGGGAVAPTPPPPAQPSDPAADTEVATLPLPLIDNDYWVMRDTENLIQLFSGAPSNVLFLGDSITDFLQNASGAPVWDEYYAPLGALDFGVAAIRTSHVLWQVESGQVALAAPQVVVLLIGSNNLGLGQDPAEVAEGIAKIVYELGVQLPQTRVLLLGLLPRGFSATDPFRDQIADVNWLISGLDDGDRVMYMDIGWLFLEPDGTISPDVMSDGAHPTLWGYQLYTSEVLPALKELLDP